MIFLEDFARVFLAFHLLFSFASLILLFPACLYVVFRETPDWPFGKNLTLLGAGSYILNLLTGILIYPVFKVNVRAYDFDKNKQWATALFEIKEHLAALGLFAAIALSFIILFIKKGNMDEPTEKTVMHLVYFSFSVVLLSAVVGFILTALHPI